MKAFKELIKKHKKTTIMVINKSGLTILKKLTPEDRNTVNSLSLAIRTKSNIIENNTAIGKKSTIIAGIL